MEIGSTLWYVVLLLGGVAVGVVIAIAQTLWRDR